MGMTCTVYRATDEEIDRLLEEPAGLADFLDPDDGSALRTGELEATTLRLCGWGRGRGRHAVTLRTGRRLLQVVRDKPDRTDRVRQVPS